MIRILQGDCIEKMKELPDNSVDSIVTDPPYELGFMGKSWDNTGIANNPVMWKEALRVLKPGGHLLAFSGTRTHHRMASAIEDAGFEVRDMIEWVYGSGFPKSLNIGKAVDKRGGTTADQSREFAAYIKNRRLELNIPITKADQIICDGTTNYSWFEGRPKGQRLPRKADYLKMKELLKLDDRYDDFMEETEREFLGKHTTDMGGLGGERLGQKGGDITKGTSEWEGWGTALKPAHEPICMARKPLAEKSVAENVLKYGTGGINIDESRVATNEKLSIGSNKHEGNAINFGMKDNKEAQEQNALGRFPANLIHDNSEEVRECFPESNSGKGKASTYEKFGGQWGKGQQIRNEDYGDSGNASRFFKSIIYQAKASKSERNRGCEELEDRIGGGMNGTENQTLLTGSGNIRNNITKNNHPTVKPVALMEYLIKMVTKKGGTVLDPFMGSGSTGVACKQSGFNFIGIELEADYIKIAEARIGVSTDNVV